MSKFLKNFVIVSAVAVVGFLFVKNMSDPSIPKLPQQYDIDAINAEAAKLPQRPMPTTLNEWRTQIVEDMTDYLKEYGEVGYTLVDVTKCDAHMESFISAISKPEVKSDDIAILSVSKSLVLALNELNAGCDHSLIETMERENLLEMIFLGARQAGYSRPIISFEDDFTIEWRDW